jgi:hypothetical protein
LRRSSKKGCCSPGRRAGRSGDRGHPLFPTASADAPELTPNNSVTRTAIAHGGPTGARHRPVAVIP